MSIADTHGPRSVQPVAAPKVRSGVATAWLACADGPRVVEGRVLRGLSREDVAAAVSAATGGTLSPERLALVEHGALALSFDELVALGTVLGVRVGELSHALPVRYAPAQLRNRLDDVGILECARRTGLPISSIRAVTDDVPRTVSGRDALRVMAALHVLPTAGEGGAR